MKIIKALCVSTALLSSSIAAAEADMSAQLMIELRFGGASVESNFWQANALVGQRLSLRHNTLPVYSYSLNSRGETHSTLMGTPITMRDGSLSVDGGLGLSTIMTIAGFAVAGLVIADQVTDDKTPPVEDSGNNGDIPDLPIDVPIDIPDLPIDVPDLPVDVPDLPDLPIDMPELPGGDIPDVPLPI